MSIKNSKQIDWCFIYHQIFFYKNSIFIVISKSLVRLRYYFLNPVISYLRKQRNLLRTSIGNFIFLFSAYNKIFPSPIHRHIIFALRTSLIQYKLLAKIFHGHPFKICNFSLCIFWICRQFAWNPYNKFILFFLFSCISFTNLWYKLHFVEHCMEIWIDF